MRLKEIRGTVSLDGTLNITISLKGVNNATTICEALSALNSMAGGQMLDGALAFISLASRIYQAIKAAK